MLLPLVLTALLTGCGERVRFSDSIGTDPLIGAGPLVGDYVLGATFSLEARRPGLRTLRGWTLSSSDPEVLRLTEHTYEDKRIAAQAYALGLGEAQVELRDPSGELEASAPVYVGFPDALELHSYARALVGQPSELGDQTPLQVLVNGTGTFETRFFEGDRRLYGKTTLSGTAPDVEVGAPSASLGVDSQYLTLTPLVEGEHEVSLVIEAQPLGTVSFTAVPYDAVSSLELSGTEADDPSQDSVQNVVAELRDASQQPIFGALCSWTLDNRPLEGVNDRVMYSYDRRDERALVAECDGFTASSVIHGYDVRVVGTSNVGCSTAPEGALGLAAALAALGVRRRRTPSAG